MYLCVVVSTITQKLFGSRKTFFQNLMNGEDNTVLTKFRHVWIHHVEGKEQCGRSDMFGRSKVLHDIIHPQSGAFSGMRWELRFQ